MNMFKKRKYEAYNPDLENRIITASFKIEQKKNLMTEIYLTFQEFKFPKPLYTFTAIFILGLSLNLFVGNFDESLWSFENDFYITGEMP